MEVLSLIELLMYVGTLFYVKFNFLLSYQLLYLCTYLLVNATGPIEIRLVNGATQFEGRLEVLYAGYWGTVCNDFFNLTAANVLCRQLGFPGALRVADDQEFGMGRNQIWLDDIQCTGNESSILQCSNNGYGVHNCQHAKDVGVACIG